ncbi:beta-ketoacyl-ACP synthase II, partial [bacterium]|nr:beta-ketoacyl-ACP synthase II [bacterium]
MTKRRVVITGMGVVSPYGIGADKFWNAVVEGKSAVSRLENMDVTGHSVLIGGEIKQSVFNPNEHFDPKEARRLDKFVQYAIIAAREAYKDSNINIEKEDPYRVGVVVGSGAGGFKTIEDNYKMMLDRGPTKCSPFTIPMLIVNMAAGKIAIDLGLKGLNKCISSACATSAHAIGDAFRSIQYGDADVILSGGTEAVITTMGIGAFTASRTLSKHNDEPEKASRPYDKDRDGFVMAEGAGIIVLEELEHAKARGAKIYGEIVGYGQTCDAYDVVAPLPDGSGAAKTIELALKDANLTPSDIQYINTHGTSTHVGDTAESYAVERIFGDKDKNPNLYVSSTKSSTGHMIGAAGVVE